MKKTPNYRNPQSHDMVFIDSSAIDVIRKNKEWNTFFETKNIMVIRSPSLEREINHPSTPEKTQAPFKGIKWFTADTPLTPKEIIIKDGIIKILQGKAKKGKHENDALHIFHTVKNEGYLIAIDRRIIKKRDEISEYLFKMEFGTYKFMKTRFIFMPCEFIEISGSNL